MDLPVQLDLPALPAFDWSNLKSFNALISRIISDADRPDRILPVPGKARDLLVMEAQEPITLKWTRFYYLLDKVTPESPVVLANGDSHDGPYYHIDVVRIIVSAE